MWFKVDDLLHGHWKSRNAGLAALGLWVVAGSYASSQLTDGFVPAWFVDSWSAKRHAARLVAAGMWHVARDADGLPGWLFHDWDNYQPTREQVLADRARNRQRQTRWRNAVTDGVSNGVTDGVTDTVTRRVSHSVSNGAPTRPRPETHSPRSLVSVDKSKSKRHQSDARAHDDEHIDRTTDEDDEP